jgi:hypothetical protein
MTQTELREPISDAEEITGLMCLYRERAGITVDGQAQP